MKTYQAIVVGAGPAGLTAACLLAQAGAQTAIIGSKADKDDPRTVALMLPTIDLLTAIDLWPNALATFSAPLRKLRIVDDTGGRVKAPDLSFSSVEAGEQAFGWNVPLAQLVPALAARAQALGAEQIEAEVSSSELLGSKRHVVTTAGEFEAAVVLAADGRNSSAREAAGIGLAVWSYDQVAIATSFAHSIPHSDTSTEYHRRSGPFTTVPLSGNRSSLVWMERPAGAEKLLKLDDKRFAAEIQIATHGDLGLISDIGPRRSFPMRGHTARSFAKDRIILIGEAAHAVPPIGAQGLNMSLKDAAHAAELVADAISANEDPGEDSVLRDYHLARRADVLPRQAIIDVMNRSLLSEFELFGMIRALGLAAAGTVSPLRRFAIRRGMGTDRNLPRATQN